MAAGGDRHYGPLRSLVQPYILRRLKTDGRVIADLPDKTELKAFCQLTRKQAALYQQAVADLAAELERADGMKRRGVVLASLMRLKQICNHPSQWLGDGSWSEADSGKLARLREIAEVIAAKQEKVLVFTQFRETTTPLAAFLESSWREGARERRSRGDVRDRDGAGDTGEAARQSARAIAHGQSGRVVQTEGAYPAGEAEDYARERRRRATADTEENDER
jgi:non-specific serine/threonine protein kinase